MSSGERVRSIASVIQVLGCIPLDDLDQDQ